MYRTPTASPRLDMPFSHLAHLKASEGELRQALHAVNALCDRVQLRGDGVSPAELDAVLSRIEAAAVYLRAAASGEEKAG